MYITAYVYVRSTFDYNYCINIILIKYRLINCAICDVKYFPWKNYGKIKRRIEWVLCRKKCLKLKSRKKIFLLKHWLYDMRSLKLFLTSSIHYETL